MLQPLVVVALGVVGAVLGAAALLANQRSAGHGLGQINPTLYKLASGPNYGTYFYDVTTGNNGAAAPTVPGFPATKGWDPVATATVKSASRDNHKVLMWVVPEKKAKSAGGQ